MNIIQKHIEGVTDFWRLEAVYNMFQSMETTTNQQESLRAELLRLSMDEMKKHEDYDEYVKNKEEKLVSKLLNNELNIVTRVRRINKS